MNVLITCGTPGSDLDAMFAILQAGGVASPRPSDRDAAATIASWHDRLLASRGGYAAPEQIRPGKAWELAAAEILLANWEQPLWGWADPRSLGLLEFWRDFDPQTRFILSFSRAEQVLARTLFDPSNGSLDIREILKTWVASSSEMLRFYNRNRERCALVDTGEALTQPETFLQACADALGIAFTHEVGTGAGAPVSAGPLSILLARQALNAFPEVEELQLEIEASLVRCLAPAEYPSDEPYSSGEALLAGSIAQLQTLVHEAGPVLEQYREANGVLQDDRIRLVENLARLEARYRDQETSGDELKELAAQRLGQIEQLAREQRERDRGAVEREQQLQSELDRIQDEAQQAFTRREQELSQESELLLLQLHQTQEELEQLLAQNEALQSRLAERDKAIENHVLTCRERQGRIDVLERERTSLVKSRDDAGKQATERQARIAMLEQAKTALTQARDEASQQATARQARIQVLEQEKAALAKVRDDAGKQATERQARIAMLEQAKTALTQARDEASQQATARQARIQALEQEKAALAKARDDVGKQATERQARIAVLEQAKTALTQARDEASQQATGRQARIQALEQEKAALAKARDDAGKQATERQARIAALEQESAALTKARDTGIQLIAGLHAQIDVLNGEKAELAASLEKQAGASKERDKQHEAAVQQFKVTEQDLREQGEFVLLQFHQVQEALEQYYLRCQELERKVQEQNGPWARFLEHHPDYCDWSSIEVLANERTAAGARLRWLIKGLNVRGRDIPDFEVSTLMRKGKRALVFDRAVNGTSTSPLLRWSQEDKSEQLILEPVGEEVDRQQRSAALADLTTSDWYLVRVLCSTLSDALQSGSVRLGNAERPDMGFWLSELTALRGEFEQFPAVWRYDTVELKHEQVNPGYEHLWFSLSNASFGDRHWREFEFRLGAAAVRSGAFSLDPKLEFPQMTEGDNQFENWFAESHDHFGPKLELRFELSAQAMDIDVWSQLSRTDKAQFTSLAATIPTLLDTLETAGNRISRPWPEWRQLADAIIGVMWVRLAAASSVSKEDTQSPPNRRRETKSRFGVTRTAPSGR